MRPYRLIAAIGATAALAAGGTTRPGAAANRTTDLSAQWTRTGRNIIAGVRNLYNPRVLRVNDRAYPWRMWLFGWATADCNRNIAGFTGCDAIFTGRAHNLDGPWEIWSADHGWRRDRPDLWRPVLAPGSAPWDGWHNGDPSVVYDHGRFYMAYSSVGHNSDGIPYGARGDTDGSLLCIMGATSADGVHWTRGPKPILIHTPDIGAAPVAEGEAHLRGSYNRPSLLHEDGRFRLWFDYWPGAREGVSLGYAENDGDFLDPSAWRLVRAGATPAITNWPNPNVVRVGPVLLSHSDACGYTSDPWTGRKLTTAVSVDGIHWVPVGHIEPDRDAPAIHVPEALTEPISGGAWRVSLFYACQTGGTPYDYRYTRIRRAERHITPTQARAWAHQAAAAVHAPNRPTH